jgi:phosphoribosylformylglycinamidine synthase subunit PurL
MLSAEDFATVRQKLGREPTDVEIACFENLWSEHCSYRSTKNLLRTLPTQGVNVLLGPGDDAAIVRFSDTCALAISMESHNHPSYVDPHDGAATGVGGIVRDVLSMGSRPIALMDPLFFGSLDSEKNRHLFEHVVGGIGGYGNCIGVPVVRGDLVFDPDYSGNPLVNVVCVGTVQPDRFITARVKCPGNHLVLVGASTGRDGLGGASFASRDLSQGAEADDRPSVQIGDPFTEKLVIEAILEMAATEKVLSCRDLGAAGLAGASSEMCSTFGGLLHADHVHQRERGMKPVEIMVAESQERMLVEVDPCDVPLIGRIAEKYDLRWSDIGEVIADPRYIITFHGKVVCDLPIHLLSGETPLCSWEKKPYNAQKPFKKPKKGLKSLALQVLSHPEVARRDWVIEQYDHDVQTRTLSIAHDAAVLRLGDAALVLSCGCNPRQIFLKPFEGTANAVYENAANLACMGAIPLCLLDCLNFASPVNPEVYWQLEQCIFGMGDMARRMNIPVVGGNVSLYNESDEFNTKIKPTPTVGMVGKGEVVRSWQQPADGYELALIGSAGAHFGGSVLDAVSGCGGTAPDQADPAIVDVIRTKVGQNAFEAVTDISQGGLLSALSVIAPQATVRIDGDPYEQLFSETYGRFLAAIKNESALKGLNYRVIGEVGGDSLKITAGKNAFAISKKEMEKSLSYLTRLMRQGKH